MRHCPQCKTLWDTYKLEDSLQEVNWEEDLLDSKVCFLVCMDVLEHMLT